MGRLGIFRSLTSIDNRLGFYTKETRNTIPESPGCYAWFLPLWFYRSDLDELLRLVDRVLRYDPHPDHSTEIRFAWDVVHLRAHRGTTTPTTDKLREIWNRVTSDPTAADALQETLLEASLLMPPLYVGRSRNLRQRYRQHTGAAGDGKNDFRSRFTAWAAKHNLALGVGDLLFVSLTTREDLRRALDQAAPSDDVEALMEQILMQFCRPPFSLR